jgi:pimeloyl-ACP methyl ester carboxylesterase
VRVTATFTRWAPKHAPRALLAVETRGQPADEAATIRAQGLWFPSILGEGAADPRGVVDEYRALVAPWGFTPEELSVPVRIFQGSADQLVPRQWGPMLTQRIPHSSDVVFPGEGHFIGVTRREEVLRWLADTGRPTDS